MSRHLAALLLAAFWAAPALADDSPIVVELFTSQGCSSCPPADKYLGQLAKRPGVLALAFHVEYWNYIGWVDPYSKPWATRRQRQYETTLKLRYIYTPEIVVQGTAEGVGSEPGVIEPLIRSAETNRPPHPDLGLHWRGDGALVADIGASRAEVTAPATLWLVGFDKMHTMPVTAGENQGLTSWDHHPVRSFRRLGDWNGTAEQLVVPADEAKHLGEYAAVLLQVNGNGPILTAASLAQPDRTTQSESAAQP
jgi:hypothetical protein